MARSHFATSHLFEHWDVKALKTKLLSTKAINRRVAIAIVCTLPSAILATLLAGSFSSSPLSLSMMLTINCFVYMALFMDRPSTFSAIVGSLATVAVMVALQSPDWFLPQVAALAHAAGFFAYALRYLYLRPFCLVMTAFWLGFSLPLI